jgi:hypothetical protein
MKNDWGWDVRCIYTRKGCGGEVAGPIGRRGTGRGGWMHFPATTISGINTPHISAPVILHPPALEDGTDRGFRNVGF